MAIPTNDGFASGGVDFLRQLIAKEIKRWQLSITIIAEQQHQHMMLMRETMLQVFVGDAAEPETQLMSFKTRVRGFFKVLVSICQRIADEKGHQVYLTTVDGTRRVTPGLDVLPPLTAEDAWKEFQAHPHFKQHDTAAPPPRRPSILISFREPF